MTQGSAPAAQAPKGVCTCVASTPSGHEISLADKIGLANDAIVGAAALIALYAAIIAVRALKWQIATAVRSLQSEYYRTVVVEPSLDSVHEAETQSLALIEEFGAKLQQCQDVAEGRAILAELVARYRLTISAPHRRILRSVSALGDDDLKARIAERLFAVEDVNADFPKLVTDPNTISMVLERLRAATDELLATIIQHDLVTVDTLGGTTRKPFRRIRARIVRALTD